MAVVGLLSSGAVLVGRPTEVVVARARRAPLREQVVATGHVLAGSRAVLGVPMAGRVGTVLVDRGARVKAGQLLVAIDAAALSATADERRAALRAQEARVAQIETTALAAAAAAQREADAATASAEADLRRAKALRAAEALPASALEAAEVTLARARSRQASARAALDDVSDADLRLARARVAEAAAALRTALARRAEAEVRAPGSGVVLERRTEPGDVVTAGQPLLVLALDGEARVAVELDERHLGRVRVGQPAQVSAEAWPDRHFEAAVTTVGPGVDAALGTVQVRLRIEAATFELAPDLTVSAAITTGERTAALVVPPEAVREGRDGSRWCAVIRGDRLEKVPVTIGLRSPRAVEIEEGLAEGDLVAVGDTEPPLRRRVRTRERG